MAFGRVDTGIVERTTAGMVDSIRKTPSRASIKAASLSGAFEGYLKRQAQQLAENQAKLDAARRMAEIDRVRASQALEMAKIEAERVKQKIMADDAADLANKAKLAEEQKGKDLAQKDGIRKEVDDVTKTANTPTTPTVVGAPGGRSTHNPSDFGIPDTSMAGAVDPVSGNAAPPTTPSHPRPLAD